jgi:ATP-dependent Lon protease
MPDVLPLFPLPNVVLFPGMELALQIFEERYKQMMHDILPDDGQFGIQFCRAYNPETLEGVPFDVGTIAEVIDYKILDDGCMSLRVKGKERFHVTAYDSHSKPYLLGTVSPHTDQKDGYVTQKLLGETTALFNEALSMTHRLLKHEARSAKALPTTAAEISFFIAENLRGSLVLKQELLEMTSNKERLIFERKVLTKMVKTLAVRCQIEDAFRKI